MYTNVHSQNNYQANLSNRSYGFKRLAVLYFPNIAPASAVSALNNWIKDDVELLGSLEETNYHLSNFPPLQPYYDHFRFTLLTP